MKSMMNSDKIESGESFEYQYSKFTVAERIVTIMTSPIQLVIKGIIWLLLLAFYLLEGTLIILSKALYGLANFMLKYGNIPWIMFMIFVLFRHYMIVKGIPITMHYAYLFYISGEYGYHYLKVAVMELGAIALLLYISNFLLKVLCRFMTKLETCNLNNTALWLRRGEWNIRYVLWAFMPSHLVPRGQFVCEKTVNNIHRTKMPTIKLHIMRIQKKKTA